MDFGRIWGGFGWILGGFKQDFSNIFRIFIENRDFVENSVFPRKNQYFAGFQLFKNYSKNQMKIDANAERGDKSAKLIVKVHLGGLGLRLGKIWEGSGPPSWSQVEPSWP